MTSRARSWTACALSCTGFSRPFCWACRVPLDGLRESWGAWPYELSLELVAAQYGPLSYKTDRQLAGTVEADDLYHTAGNKDKRKAVARRRWGARAWPAKETRARSWPL